MLLPPPTIKNVLIVLGILFVLWLGIFLILLGFNYPTDQSLLFSLGAVVFIVFGFLGGGLR